ncbi:3741_t:CDS:2, partial [Ambispora gerdemannii]
NYIPQIDAITGLDQPFTPIFVVEVAGRSDFEALDKKSKSEYFTMGSSVQLGCVDGDVLPGSTLKMWKIEDAIS